VCTTESAGKYYVINAKVWTTESSGKYYVINAKVCTTESAGKYCVINAQGVPQKVQVWTMYWILKCVSQKAQSTTSI
jgi:hypothetical protein